MTTKEKAIELVSAYARIDGYVDSIDMSKCEFEKKCALIAVDELIEVTASIEASDYYYWQEVKKEIEKLWYKILATHTTQSNQFELRI